MVEIMKMMFLVAFLLLHAEYVEGFEFRLLRTNSQGTEGFVELFHNGKWGSIGSPEFKFSDATATLLCRKFNSSVFGYGASYSYLENNYFSTLWLKKLECNGNELSIDECVEIPEWPFPGPYPGLLNVYGSKLYCVDNRLIGGLSPNTGMLVAAFSGTQHSMCYQGFDSSAGDVVCKHLRYNGLVDFTEGDPGLIPLFNNTLTCTGNESSLNECTMSDAVIDNCTRAVYITCKAVRLTGWNMYTDEGAVEILYNGSWGYLGSWNYAFNDVTAQFLCETFGFRNVGFSSGYHSLRSYVGKGWFGYLSCNGTEADIMQCGRPSSFRFIPYYHLSLTTFIPRGTWLYCFDFNITSMRLVNGPTPNEGDVELQIGGRWGSIYIESQRNTSQVKNVGSVVCKILGYVGVSEIVVPFVTDYYKFTWMSNVSCNGNEIDLTDCSYTKGGHSYYTLAVKCEDTDQCQSNPCLNNGTCVDGDRSYTCTCTERWSGINCETGFEFRLLPTNSQGTEGFVELFYNGFWGLIGRPEFKFSDVTATLLCRKFNLSVFGYGATYSYRENYTLGSNWLKKLECNGNELSIDECVKIPEWPYPFPYIGVYGSKLICVDYRLMGGLSPNTGMLLAAFSDTEHSMCYQAFDSNAGDVVCKHLRYNGLVGFTEGDPGLIPLFNNKLTCTGNESSLNECTMSNTVIENCTRAVYITCKAVRLTRWNEYTDEGAVEIFNNGSWGYLGSWEYAFNDVTAQFLCETFGFGNVGFSSGYHSLRTYVGKGWFGYLSCNGTEADIMQCERPSSFIFYQPYRISVTNFIPRGTWLYCFDFNITSMRLDGPNPNDGDVQLQIGGRWGSIFMEGQRNTSQVKTVGSVVCKILGYVGVSAILNSNSSVRPYVENNKHVWMSNLSCNGNEIELTDCSYTKGGHSYDILAVKCEDTDQCQSNPCLNNGTCVDGDRSYTCTCTERWSGINCEIDLEYDICQEQPCDNNSTCINSPAGYKCMCTEGYNGDNCAIDIDECSSGPCENNGNCTDSSNRYICSCVQGYGGERCQIDIDECLSQPCENNGACVNATNGFVCYCDQGYEGYRCQNEIGDQTTLIVVLISSICVLSIVVLATVCCCIRYRREHKKTKSDASKGLNSGTGGLQNTKEVETVPKEMEEGHCNDVDYEVIKENTLDDVADYINDVSDVEQLSDVDGYVKFADNDQNVVYYKLKHTKNEDYSKLSGCKY